MRTHSPTSFSCSNVAAKYYVIVYSKCPQHLLSQAPSISHDLSLAHLFQYWFHFRSRGFNREFKMFSFTFAHKAISKVWNYMWTNLIEAAYHAYCLSSFSISLFCFVLKIRGMYESAERRYQSSSSVLLKTGVILLRSAASTKYIFLSPLFTQ